MRLGKAEKIALAAAVRADEAAGLTIPARKKPIRVLDRTGEVCGVIQPSALFKAHLKRAEVMWGLTDDAQRGFCRDCGKPLLTTRGRVGNKSQRCRPCADKFRSKPPVTCATCGVRVSVSCATRARRLDRPAYCNRHRGNAHLEAGVSCCRCGAEVSGNSATKARKTGSAVMCGPCRKVVARRAVRAPDGNSYPSLTAAAKAYNLSIGTINKRIADRAGWAYVDGPSH